MLKYCLIDLSIFSFLATFNAIDKNMPIKYYHGLAENTNLKNVHMTLLFNFYFMKYQLNLQLIINELYRILKPNGVLTIVDLDLLMYK